MYGRLSYVYSKHLCHVLVEKVSIQKRFCTDDVFGVYEIENEMISSL